MCVGEVFHGKEGKVGVVMGRGKRGKRGKGGREGRDGSITGSGGRYNCSLPLWEEGPDR